MEPVWNAATYDDIYMELYEIAQRYFTFTELRMIGNTHDERGIPLLEIGKGSKCLYIVSGIYGGDNLCVFVMLNMIKEYCVLYEKKWEMDQIYDVKALLDKVKLCFVPIVNPDGYEIARAGYRIIRNPVLRQMLRMQDVPHTEYKNNARNVNLEMDFPLQMDIFQNANTGTDSLGYTIENETRALLKIFYDYESVGLIILEVSAGKIIQYKTNTRFQGIYHNRKLVNHLKKTTGFYMENEKPWMEQNRNKPDIKGNCGQYYAREIRKPAFRIEIPEVNRNSCDEKKYYTHCYQSLKTIPLEFIFAM